MVTIYRKPGVIEIAKGWSFNYRIFQYEDTCFIFSLVYLTFYIRLPWIKENYEFCDRSWGVAYHGCSIWWKWGEKSWCWHMPWDWKHVRKFN